MTLDINYNITNPRKVDQLLEQAIENRLPNVSNTVATRMLGMRTGTFDNTTQKTFRVIIEVADAGFARIRPIFANGATGGTYTVAGCNARALANLTDALPSPTAVTLPSSGVVPAAPSASRRGYLLGNWTDVNSVPRTDGGKGALICIDAYVSTSASISIVGNGSNDVFTGWATRTNRKFIMQHNDGDCVTTPANFVSTTNRSQSPIVGVQYAALGRVVTVMGIGDSISDGRGTLIGEGFIVPACEAASNSNVYFENINLGFAGVGAPTYRTYLSDAVAAGIIPDVIVFPNGTPNSLNTPITATDIQSCRAATASILADASLSKIYPIVTTTLPTNPSIKDYNSSDSLRVSWNTDTLAFPGISVVDLSTVLSGDLDADGQVNMLAGATTDNIHPNDLGNSLLAAPLAVKLKQLV